VFNKQVRRYQSVGFCGKGLGKLISTKNGANTLNTYEGEALEALFCHDDLEAIWDALVHLGVSLSLHVRRS